MPYSGEKYIIVKHKSHKDCGGANYSALIWQHYWKIGGQYGKTQCAEALTFEEVGQLMGGN